MPHIRWNGHHITGTDVLHKIAFLLHTSAARSDNQNLASRMGVPVNACAWLESYPGATGLIKPKT